MRKSDKLWRECDKLWSELVCLKAQGICQFCRKRLGSGAHHVIPRRHTGTAFTDTNGIWLCSACHNHDNPYLQAKSISIIGQAEYARLWEIARQVTLLRKTDLCFIRVRLERELVALKNGV